MREAPSRTVLIVDDNEVNRALLLRQIERLGYQGTAVPSGTEAVAAVEASQFALILMDCRMPGMDGTEAARRIRKAEAGTGRRLPIVAVTANAMEGDREACLAAGMDDFLTKPVMLDILQAALDRFVGGPEERPLSPAMDAGHGPIRPEDGDEGPVPQLVRIYLSELPARVRDIHQAVETGNPDALAFAAHTLKSTSVLVGATGLMVLCSELEAAGRAGRAAELTDRLPFLDEESEAVRSTLEGAAAKAAR